MDEQSVIDGTRRWISSMVIGLNLCPFAQRVFKADKIRYVVSDAHDEAILRLLCMATKINGATRYHTAGDLEQVSAAS